MLVFLLLVAHFPIGLHSRIVKYKIPYEYLITRRLYDDLSHFMDNPVSSITSIFNDGCKLIDCYAVVFHENGYEYFQILQNLNNTGLNPFNYGMSFNKLNYKYTIAFLTSKDSKSCLNDPNYLNFTIPKCPNGWSNYTRTNGRIYCFYLTQNMTRTEGFIACNNASKGANITGYQTLEERIFVAALLQRLTTESYVHIGAELIDLTCYSNNYLSSWNAFRECLKKKMYWYENITLSGNREPVPFIYGSDHIDGSPSPYCLQMSNVGYLDDNSCNSTYPVLCGKYADDYT